MLTKAPSSPMTQKALSHYVQMKPQIRTMLKWRAEWVHVYEEVLNDNNNGLRGWARNNFQDKKRLLWCFERQGEHREGKKEEKSRGVGEVGVLHSDRKFHQKKLAWVLTTQHRANGYTQMLMCLHTRSQLHTQTLICSAVQ